MWLEAILSEEDLVRLVSQLLPLRIPLGEEGHLHVSNPRKVALVPNVGLSVQCEAELHWPILGITVPVTVTEATVLLCPTVEKRPTGEALVVKLALEHADVALLPSLIDDRITEKVNKELTERKIGVDVNMTQALSHKFAMPAELAPLSAFALDVAWVKVKVTNDAVVLAVSFHSSVLRDSSDGTATESQAERRREERIEREATDGVEAL